MPRRTSIRKRRPRLKRTPRPQRITVGLNHSDLGAELPMTNGWKRRTSCAKMDIAKYRSNHKYNLRVRHTKRSVSINPLQFTNQHRQAIFLPPMIYQIAWAAPDANFRPGIALGVSEFVFVPLLSTAVWWPGFVVNHQYDYIFIFP